MPSTRKAVLQTLESWRSTAFLLAGVVLFGFVALSGITEYTNILGESAPVGAMVVGAGILGLILGVVGLLGLYRQLRDAAPRLARVGGASLLGALTGIAIVVVTLAIVGPPEYPGDVPGFVPPIFITSGLLIMVGYLSFAAASLKTATPSRYVGGLLAVPAIVLVWHYAVLAAFGSSTIFELLDYTIISTALVVLGYRLRRTASAPSQSGTRPKTTSQ